MKDILSKIIFYRALAEDPVLKCLAEADAPGADAAEARSGINSCIHSILETATTYGFTEDLWAAYLTFLLVMDENPYALVNEHRTNPEGSADILVESDCACLIRLMHYDFSNLAAVCGEDRFTLLRNYTALSKPDRMYFSFISRTINELARDLRTETDPAAFRRRLVDFYRNYGTGMFGLNKAFRLRELPGGEPELIPINNLEQVNYDDLVGYETQKKQVFDNTSAFLDGRAANNILLYGDAGTGKTTTIKATLNAFYPKGLRLIEIYKHQFRDLSYVISKVKSRNYKFIIFMDDLSFEEFETEYKYLKAVIEGGFETRPDNILIYATSNRRHLIKETLSDRNDMIDQEDIHHSDTMEEKLSLVDRFGLNILFTRPTFDEYHQIVRKLAAKHGIDMPDDELIRRASTWSVRKGGYTGRIAQQFINSLNPKL